MNYRRYPSASYAFINLLKPFCRRFFRFSSPWNLIALNQQTGRRIDPLGGEGISVGMNKYPPDAVAHSPSSLHKWR
jgi:hypothetical protein